MLDEYLHSYSVATSLPHPDKETSVVLFVSVPKSPQTPRTLLDSFASMQHSAHPVKYLADTFYDIYLMHDTDISVIRQTLQAYQDAKHKKTLINETAQVAIRCGGSLGKDQILTLVRFRRIYDN